MKLAFLDTETTGTSSFTDRIIEIGIFFFEDDKITHEYTTLVNPQIPISPFITQITGIKTSDLTSAPAFEDIALNLRDLLSDYVIVAHNARFDYSFLRDEFRRIGIKFQSPTLCTVRLSRKLFPHHHHHNLDSIIKRFGFSIDNRHRALDDARILVDFFNHIKASFPLDDLQSTIDHLLGHPSLPLNLPESEIQSSPNCPGVYIFYSQDNIPLYVGKSVDLKSRILSHFYESMNSSKEMKLATLTHSLKTLPTAGELSALLLESKLIKELQPLHNRLLRLTHKMIALYESVTPDGYLTVSQETISSVDVSKLDKFLGIFKSPRQLQNHLSEIAQTYNLCTKLLGLEKTKSNCFSYHLGKCKGACTNAELPVFYNIRFTQAFSRTRIKRWPFPSPILITEYNPDSELTKRFVVDQWCIISEHDQSPDFSSPYGTGMPVPYNFDLDTYKILLRFILDPKNQSKIKIISKTK